MTEVVKNASDKEQIERVKKHGKFLRRRELDDIRDILSRDSGKRFIWRYLDACGVFRSSWHPSAAIHFNEGRRDVGLQMIADVTEARPEALIEMMKESNDGAEKAPEGD